MTFRSSKARWPGLTRQEGERRRGGWRRKMEESRGGRRGQVDGWGGRGAEMRGDREERKVWGQRGRRETRWERKRGEVRSSGGRQQRVVIHRRGRSLFCLFFTNCSSRYRTSQSRTVIAPSSGIRSERAPSVSPIQYPVNTHRPCVSEKASGSDLWWFHESGAEHPQANSYNSLCQNSLSTELGNIYFIDSVFTSYSRIRLGHMYNQRTWQSVSCSLYGPNKSGQHGNWEHSNDPDGLLARTLYFIFSDCTVAAWCTVCPVIETPFRRTLIT